MEFIAQCVCGNKRILPDPNLTIKSALEKISLLVCSKCKNPVSHLLDNNNRMIYGSIFSSRCLACDEFIPLPRLEIVHGTSLCTDCAAIGESDVRTPPPHPNATPELVLCLSCSSSTVMRQNGSDKSWFVGYSSYPTCRWTKNIG